RTCSTCRVARETVTQAGVPILEREYFKEPFTEAELRGLLGDRPAADFFSWRSPTARSLGLPAKRAELSNDQLIALMIEQPNLINPPLFLVGGELVAGFDPPTRKRLADLLGTSVEPAPRR